MERPIISLEKFKEIFEDIGFETDETSFFVNTLLSAASGNVPVFYNYYGVILTVTPCSVTVDCNIIYDDICIEVALFQPVGE